MQAELKELKEENRGKLDQLESKVRNAEIEKAEISAREQSAKESLFNMTKERHQVESEMQDRIEELKKTH